MARTSHVGIIGLDAPESRRFPTYSDNPGMSRLFDGVYFNWNRTGTVTVAATATPSAMAGRKQFRAPGSSPGVNLPVTGNICSKAPYMRHRRIPALAGRR